MIKKYGILGSLKMFRNIMLTRVLFPASRLVRFPIEIRNRKHIDLGKGLTTGIGCRLEALPKNGTSKICIRFGTNVQINDYVHIGAIDDISIGNNVLIASKVFITDHNHGNFEGIDPEMILAPIQRTLHSKAVKIGDNCWLGENVVVLPGVELGENCVVGASAVVTKSFPPHTLIVGNPGKAYKRYDIIDRKWKKL